MERKTRYKESVESPNDSPYKGERVAWPHTYVQNLVGLVGEHWGEFQTGVKKKKYIWKEIAESLSQDGFTVGGEECNRKWRNLKIRYLTVREKQMRGQKIACRVDYIQKIHTFLKHDPGTETFLKHRCANKMRFKREETDKDEFQEQYSNDSMMWTERSVDLLLKLMLEFKDWFANKEGNRNEESLWEEVSDQMKLEGHRPGADECCKKWNKLNTQYEFHKSEAEATGTLQLWPYYTRVRDIVNHINILSSGNETQSNLKRKRKGSMFKIKRKKRPFIKQEDSTYEDDLMERPIEVQANEHANISREEMTSTWEPKSPISDSRGCAPSRGSTSSSWDMREVCLRLDRLEEKMGICQRLDRLEAKLDDAGQQQEAHHQTNMLLGQALSELSRLSKNLSLHFQHSQNQESHDLGTGITIVVPNSNI